jgi:phosphohistidine phosphatase
MDAPLRQASAVPYRRRDGRTEFCLITSIKRGRWGFPKGIIDPGETPEITALKEAQEEAGIHGRIEGPPLGSYRYAKWGTTLEVTTLLMHVTRVDTDWPEDDCRERRWCDAEEAWRRIERPGVRQMLEAAVARLDPAEAD